MPVAGRALVLFCRALFVVVLFTLGGLAVAACGRSSLDDYLLVEDGGLPDGRETSVPDVTPCSAINCLSGCCDGTGTCQVGTTTTQCGSGGELCANCPALDFTECDTTQHACSRVTPGCSGSTCSGCCLGQSCYAGTDPNTCGVDGHQCEACQNDGLVCSGGQCTAPLGCGPENCRGCCVGTQCILGTDQIACGANGQPCENCSSQGGACVPAPGPTGGTCTATGDCSAANCPGCCLGNVCQGGGSPVACGFEGNICTDCAQLGETCNGGQCVPQQTCGADNCSFGCCDGNGVCEPGNSNVSCGEGGTLCEDCFELGETCQNQLCSSACGVQNCPGCCDDNGVCQTGNATNACGFGGNTCAVCSSFGGSCQNLQCETACNPQNCQGCCDGTQVCQPGLLDEQCGGEGSTCVDCATLMPPSTCDASLLPRACASQ